MPTQTTLWYLIGVLLVLWLIGWAVSFTAGGLIHVLLVVAVLLLIIQLCSGRRL